MPTLEEELLALKSALSLLQSRHISDIQQLSERIDTLQKQIDEQGRRASQQEQSIDKKFNMLMHVIVEHANAVVGRFENL
ncbi:MAG TPA: hypothetical protein VKR06_16625, partial [Ktedonosporobacter sp.]|nr:hypothetical protein [Ktedonosporobacter sp.]